MRIVNMSTSMIPLQDQDPTLKFQRFPSLKQEGMQQLSVEVKDYKEESISQSRQVWVQAVIMSDLTLARWPSRAKRSFLKLMN
jgi:hypothetical protein